MISQVLSLWKTKNGLDSEGDYVYGIFDDIGFSINDETGGKLLVISVIARSTDSYKKIQELCKIMGGCFSSVKIGRVEDYLAMFIPDSAGVTVADLDSMVQFVSSNYSEAGFVAHTKCFKCGQPSSRLTFKNQLVRPVCSSCASSGGLSSVSVGAAPSIAPLKKENNSFDDDDFAPVSKSYEEDRWDDESFDTRSMEDDAFQINEQAFDHNYGVEFDLDNHHSSKGAVLRGFLGALIGSVVGVLPFILIYSFTDSVVAACCVFTSIIATLIYMLFKGKHSTGIGGLLILLCSTVMSCVGTLYVLGKQSVAGSGSSSDLIKAITEISSETIAVQLVIAVVGSVLGFLVLNKVFSNYCNDK